MYKYIISYVTNTGLVILNQVEEAARREEAIESIKGSEGVSMILSIVEVKQ